MSTTATPSPITDSSLWITSLVNGLSGITIKVRHPVHYSSSPFQKIEVFETYAFGRILVLGGSIVLTERDEHIYNEMLAHVALLSHAAPKTVCIIGGGDGGVLREVLRHPGVEQVVVVEIDEAVIEVIKNNFESLAGGFADPRTEVVIDDGCAYLENAQRAFDVIIVDAYDPGGPIQTLMSGQFYETVRRTVASGGVAVFQSDSPSVNPGPLRATLDEARMHFDSVKPFVAAIPSFPDGLCSFVLCQHSAQYQPDQERVAAISAQCGYFNAEMFAGAFLLPQGIRELAI